LNTFFRVVATDLAFICGGGESGLAYFLKTTTARVQHASHPTPKLTALEADYINQSLASAWQQAVDKYGTDLALSILPIGHSENPDSRHHRSTYNLWSQGKLHPAPISRAAVDRITATRVVLDPSS
jgi:acyl-homoserine lactone acylase PvdQ